MSDLNPWVPMRRPIDLKHAGKLVEELGELTSAVARCMIQGVDEVEPVTGKSNRVWLEEECADVLANLLLVREHFGLDAARITDRAAAKAVKLRTWHRMLDEAGE